MRIHIYKEVDGLLDVLIRPARRLHRPVVFLQGLKRSEVRGRVKEAVEELSSPQTAQLQF